MVAPLGAGKVAKSTTNPRVLCHTFSYFSSPQGGDYSKVHGFFLLRSSQEASKTAQEATKLRPRRPKKLPRRLQEGPRGHQVASKTAPELPRRLQDGSRGHQVAPKTAQEAAKRLQDLARWSPGLSRTPQDATDKPLRLPERLQNGATWRQDPPRP